jgi:hypothetical protein
LYMGLTAAFFGPGGAGCFLPNRPTAACGC